MPAKSEAQLAYFKMLSENPDMAKAHGVSQDTIKEFTEGVDKNLPKRVGTKTARSKRRKN